MSKGMRTEDEVRDSAKLVLGFDKTEDGVQQGTGQITTFNQLGFRGCNDKPDGWYLPDDASKPAIILETKSETEGVSKEKHVSLIYEGAEGNQRKSTAKKQIPLICNVWPFTIWGGFFALYFIWQQGKSSFALFLLAHLCEPNTIKIVR